MRIQFLIPVILIVYFCCKKEDYKNIESYYLPYKTFTEKTVYVYETALNDSLGNYYWVYRFEDKGKGKRIYSARYNNQFIADQLSEEEVVENGTKMRAYTLIKTDSSGMQNIDVEIVNGNYFPFKVKDSLGIFLYSMKWKEPSDTTHKTSLVRNRRFLKDTTWTFDSKTLPAVVFETKDLLDDDHEGHLEIQYNGTEVYAQGIGLVFQQKLVGGKPIAFRLKSRMSLQELEKSVKQ